MRPMASLGAGQDLRRRIVRTERHPNADRPLMATVEYGGDKPTTIITGAPNLKPGDSLLKIAFPLSAAAGGPVRRRLQDDGAQPNKASSWYIESEGMAARSRNSASAANTRASSCRPSTAVGMPLADYMGDAVLEMDLTPNLARNLNVIGVAREGGGALRAATETQPA